MSEPSWDTIVTEAWWRRQAWPGFREGSAHRVVDGAADGAPPGIAIDRYADEWVVWIRERADDASLPRLVPVLRDVCGAQAVVVKRLGAKFRDSRSELAAGAPRDEVIVTDAGARLSAQTHPDVQTGVFLDLRPARRWVREHADGARVLNLFAYTGAFSVHAARGGADRVTTVDASRRALRRGRRSFELNDLDPDRHRWFCDDAPAVLRRADPGAYDLVVVDPPAFGRAGRKQFVLRRELARLARSAVEATAPGGHVLLACHDPDLDLEAGVTEALAGAAGGIEIVWRFAPDPDFPGLVRVRRDEVSVALSALAVKVGSAERTKPR